MERRAKGVYARRAPGRSAFVVMVCKDPDEVDRVSGLMRDMGSGSLVTYRRICDLAMNAPRNGASLVILADDSPEPTVEHSLRWLRRWCPAASVAVIRTTGAASLEIVARTGGASYFARPVPEDQWRALLEHALQTAGRFRTSLPGR